jgi:hypothetical protein
MKKMKHNGKQGAGTRRGREHQELGNFPADLTPTQP